MASNSDFELEYNTQGLDALKRRLSAVSKDMQFKGGRSALRAGANVLKNEIIFNASRIDDLTTREQISRNVSVRWSSRTFRRTGNLGFRVGILGGAKTPETTGNQNRDFGGYKRDPRGLKGGDTFYWRFLEFGTKNMTDRNKFMRPSMDAVQQRVPNEFVKKYNKALDRLIANQRRNGGT